MPLFSERSLLDKLASDLDYDRRRLIGHVMALAAGNMAEGKRLLELQYKKMLHNLDELAARNQRETPLAMRDAEIAVKPFPARG